MEKRVARTLLSACLQQFHRRRGQECPRYTILGCKGLIKMIHYYKLDAAADAPNFRYNSLHEKQFVPNRTARNGARLGQFG
jgi:hypothetical protein